MLPALQSDSSLSSAHPSSLISEVRNSLAEATPEVENSRLIGLINRILRKEVMARRIRVLSVSVPRHYTQMKSEIANDHLGAGLQ